MLYRFIAKNFKSFKEVNEFSMIPEDSNHHAAFTSSEIPVLRDTVIFGANDSGKSNLVQAIKFLKDIVLTPDVLLFAKNKSFLFDKDPMNSPTVLLAEIRLEDTLYQYSIIVHLKEGILLSESLREYVDYQWKSLFNRQYVPEENLNNIHLSYKESSPNASRYETDKLDMLHKTQKTLLTELAEKELTGDHFIDSINQIYNWFSDLMILSTDTKYISIGSDVGDITSLKELYKRYFNVLGFDIDVVRFKEDDQKHLQLHDQQLSQIFSDLSKDIMGRYYMAILFDKGLPYILTICKGKVLRFFEVSFGYKYNGISSTIPFEEVSSGIQRLFYLIPILESTITSNHVAIIDDFGLSLHPLLARNILRYFIDYSKDRNSQLIFSTNQLHLMDLNLLGRKEIWFVEKKNHVSSLYPLDQYKFDAKSINIRENYLIGRFGAIPS